MTEEATERLARASFEGLLDNLLATFKTWASVAGHNVDGWQIAKSGNLLNPLGGECSFYEATMSLQRIAEMKTIAPAELVRSFHTTSKGDDDVLPCQLSKTGQASLVVWAQWDGARVRVGGPLDTDAPLPQPPTEPALLVSVEGCGPELGKWTDPVKLYALLEYGFQLGSVVEFVATPEDYSGAIDDGEDTPF